MNRKVYVGFETHRLLLFKLHYGMVPAVFVILLALGSPAPRLIAQTPAPKFAVLYAFDGHVSDGDGINPVAPLQRAVVEYSTVRPTKAEPKRRHATWAVAQLSR
jgi:hypothetical protein